MADAVATTGFARVTHGIFENLLDRYDIHILGVNYRGDPHDYNAKIYPAMQVGNQGDIYGFNRIGTLINALQPRIIFILNDIWVHALYMEHLNQYMEQGGKVVMYSPIDAKPIEYQWARKIKDIDRFVVYTEFGKEAIEGSLVEWQKRIDDGKLEEEMKFPKISVVSHGVDTTKFYPLPDSVDGAGRVVLPGRLNAKRQVYPNQEDFLNSFVVLNANRNQPRKRIDLTIQGFAKFAKDKPDNVKLYLHMGVEDMGWNILALAERYDIDSRLIISANTNTIPAVSDERLNLIYNAADVGINTSIGEGWGLVTFEHAATGAAQIVPKHSSGPEIWGDNVEYLDPEFYLITDRVLTEGGYVNTDDIANVLQKLYDDPLYLEEMQEKAYRVTQRDEYQWKNVANEMDKVFQEVLNE
jgi:glycosyltransferase involved in cell wall biosynthesis